jgi:ABC-type branched-subunit amino acid transport system substrate-binding protein
LAAANDASSSTTGITANTINVAFIGVDFSRLASTGLVPQLGDQQKEVQAFVDDINANGGVGGRKINLHFKLLDVLGGGADAIQAACIEATQEFKAAVVILPPAAARDLASCTSVTNKTLTIYATGMDSGLYTQSQGRLFTPGGMSIDRQFRGWADEMDKLGLLTGKTVGVVNGDQPQEFLNGVNNALMPELQKLGHKPALVVTLPCGTATISCQQYDAAAQKLKDAGVDTVFMTLANTFGTGLVQAAANIGYHPKYLLEGNQATNTVLKFFQSVKGDLAGAVGVGFAFALPSDITPNATNCNKIVTDRSGQVYPPGSDAFGFASVVCNEFDVVKQAADKVAKGAPNPGTLNQGALISGLEGLGTIQLGGGPDGTLSPTKHDGPNYMYLCDFQVATDNCVRRPDAPFPIAA